MVPVTRVAPLAGLLLCLTMQLDARQPNELRADVFAEVKDDERHRQIMYIGPGSTPGSMLVLTRYSASEIDGSGKHLRRSRFPSELWRPFAARLSSDLPLQIFGLRSGFFQSWIDVLDLDTRRLTRLKSWQYGDFELADVLGDAAKEVLVRYNDGVAVLHPAGQRLAFVRSPRYLYHARSIAISNSPKRAIAMWMWRDAKRGTDIGVFTADGRLTGEWNENPSDRFGVFALEDGEEGLWSAVNDEFVQRSPTGAIRRTFDVPGLGHYRYVDGGAVAAGRTVLMASAPGTTTGSVVCVFDSSGRLLARSNLPLQSWAFYIPDPKGTVFYIGSGEQVLRYDVSALP